MAIKPIRVQKEEEFERLRDRIDLEVSHARHHWALLKALDVARADYWREMNESKTFWHLTFIAHREAVKSHLGRLYDDTNGALSLSRFLETVRANRGFFSDEAFRIRLKDNRYVETLVKDRNIEDAVLDAEFASVSEADSLVKKLHFLRNKNLAHTDAELVKKPVSAARQCSLPAEEIQTLLSRASAITTKYSLYFRGSTYAGIAFADDFKTTLQWVRKGLTAFDAEMEREEEQARELGLL